MNRAWLVGAAVALACTARRGTTWGPPPEPRAPPGGDAAVSLVLLGDAGAPGRTPARVAVELERVLSTERAAGRQAVVLWLGNNVLPPRGRGCAELDAAWSRPGVAELAQAVRRHTGSGHASYAVLGLDDWRCGMAQAQLQNAPNGDHPWVMPSPHYVVRIANDGSSRVVSSCDDDACVVEAGDPAEALVELVMVDVTPWIHRNAADDADRSVAALESLLQALRTTAVRDAPVRLLVSHFPVEAAGYHGHGGGDPDATFHRLPRALQDALVGGTFRGVLGAHDRAVYADADISNAVKRSHRTWLEAPVFQVVSGAASVPDRPHRRLRYYTSSALNPALYSPHEGFAVVRISAQTATTTLHAYRGGWQTADLAVPLRTAPHPVETASPPMAPCLRCPAVPVPDR